MSDISIRQIIAHDMNLDKEKPDLFSTIMNLTALPAPAVEFFTKHIANSMKAKQIKACRFQQSTTPILSSVIKIAEQLTDEATFVEETRRMTTKLFTDMKNTSSRSSGTLFFIIYNDGLCNYIAIMKMDPNNGIQINKEKYTLEVQENMLPTTKDKLHKCAFVKLLINIFTENVHLHVLDRQQTTGEVSKFFMGTFLEAEEIPNDKIMTGRILDKIMDREMALQVTGGDSNEAIKYQLQVENAFPDGKEIDLDLELERLFRPYVLGEADRQHLIDSIKEELRSEYEDITFEFRVEREPTVMTYTSPNRDVKIIFPLHLLGNKVFVEDIVDNKVHYKVIKIRDLTLYEKRK